jgi:hypothetical protein
MNIETLYTEERNFGNKFREEQYHQLIMAIADRRKYADIKREIHFQFDFDSVGSFLKGMGKYRAEFFSMLGWPLTEYFTDLPIPKVVIEFVAEDSLGKIYRLNIEALYEMTTYGLLFLPRSNPPYPLVISQHGGMGTPELCSGLIGPSNYNDMTRRVLRKGVAVFAPQLLLWDKEFGPETDRLHIDNQLKQLGGSITALELFKLIRSIDYLHSRNDIIASKTGMIGLSYGGFYALFAAAADVRIKAAVSSCFFSNRFVYDWFDWTWFNSGNSFMDSEVCSLICPRPLYIEVADNDELFDPENAKREFKKVKQIYENLGCLQNLILNEFHGVHELCKDNKAIDFLYDHIITS